MDIWKATISAGNEAYRLSRFDEAQAHYLSACRCAQQILAAQPFSQDALVALAVSFQNLADLYFQRSEFDQAIEVYGSLASALIDLRRRRPDIETGHAIDGITRRSAVDLMHAMKVRNLQSEPAQDVLRRFSRSVPPSKDSAHETDHPNATVAGCDPAHLARGVFRAPRARQ